MNQVSSHHSGETTPVWASVKVRSPLGGPVPFSTEVCVIGAGIAGLATAYYCAKQGKSVCVLDSGPIAGGQTGRTSAHLSYVMDDRFQKLVKMFGPQKTARVSESHQIAIDEIESLIRNESIDCEFRRLDGYLFLSTDQTLNFLENELSACYKIGIQDVLLLNEFEHSGIGPAIRFTNQAQFHPVKFINGLVDALQKMGVEIHPYVRVEEVIDGEECEVKTASGKSIKCGSVVVATNSPINDRFVIHSKQSAYRTYAVASRIPKGVLPEALYWDTSVPYHYVRLLRTKNINYDFLIVGGEDHRTGQEDLPGLRFSALEGWAKGLFPEIKSPDFCWSGQIWEPVDTLAFIGRNPGDKNIYIVTGDSGQGMTYGIIGGLLITDLIHGNYNPWEILYEPSRKPLGAAAEYIKDNMNVADQYLEYFRSSPIESVNEISKRSGAVLQDGINKIAVFRDEHGALKQFSAVCPHLGGIVHWNSVEKSWDCPCHGSRFNSDGEPITGPARSCLKPWKQSIEQEELIPSPSPDISVRGLTH